MAGKPWRGGKLKERCTGLRAEEMEPEEEEDGDIDGAGRVGGQVETKVGGMWKRSRTRELQATSQGRVGQAWRQG